MRRSGWAFTAAIALAAPLACSRAAPDVVLPLFQDTPAPEVLVEQRYLGSPASAEPSRFLLGWQPWSVDGEPVLRSTGGEASFRIVHLEARARTLVLDVAEAREGAPVERPWTITIAHSATGERVTSELSDLSRIEIPAGFPTGLVTVHLVPPREGVHLHVARAGLRPAREVGDPVLVEDGGLRQQGPSVVFVTARIAPGTHLGGEICRSPPAGGERRDPGLAIDVVGAGGESLASWSWRPGPLDRVRRCRDVDLDLDRYEGYVEARFSARSTGDSVRWSGWAWTRPTNGPEGALSRRLAAGSQARPAAAPGLVIVYVMDALRSDHVGHLGGPDGVSPTYDRLAREGFTFRSHRSVAPNTLPSTRALFTGRTYVSERDWRRNGQRRPFLAERFEEAGFATGAFSGNVYVSPSFGTVQGFEHVPDETQFDPSRTSARGYNDNAERVHRAALDWLQQLPANRPAFLYLHTIHPHNPYAPPDDLEQRFTRGIASSIGGDTPTLLRLQEGELETSAADRSRIRALYAAALAYNDRELDRFLEQVRGLQGEREVFVVLTSDHGEELFEHGGILHGETLYEEQLRIPLVLWGPDSIPAGETVEPTDTLDLHATLLDVLGDETIHSSEGRSLLPLLGGSEADLPKKLFFAAAASLPGRMISTFDGRWKRIEARRGQDSWGMGVGPGRTWAAEYLYDLDSDPGETDNLASRQPVPELWLKGRAEAWLASRWQEEDEEKGEGEAPPAQPVDAQTQERLRALGYID